VNKVYTYVAPKLLKDAQGLSPLVGGESIKILQSLNLNFDRVCRIGSDLLVISYPRGQL
jgi:riboflavin biosynthesis pyrimidine reductase